MTHHITQIDIFISVQFAHKTMKPDAKVLYSIYSAWKEAVDKINDVQGLYPTFVTNVISPTSIRVAKTNGVGNVWGLEEEPLISEFNLRIPNTTNWHI